MAEGTYEYECSRAELLGIAPPKFEDWQEADRVRRENEHAEQMTELDAQDEQINQNIGKMDEINNILSITQLRLNKFKKACGSLTNLLKIRGGADADELQPDEGNAAATSTETVEQSSADGAFASSNTELKKSSTDMQQKMSSQIDKLDALLTKAENAQYSMEHQNKQMKSFLAK